MIERMRRHEALVQERLAGAPGAEALRELLADHDRQIRWMQHERLVHLLVTLFVCLFALLALGFAMLSPGLPAFALGGLLALMALAYLVHYYRIENGVQRWYGLSDRIRERLRGTP